MSDTSTAHDGTILSKEPPELQPHVVQNAELVEAKIASTHRNLLARLFPGVVEREVHEHELAQIRIGFEYRRRALRMAVETRLQAIEEMCNHVLVTGKGEIRRQRQEFFAEQMLKLRMAMDNCAEQFNQQVERRLNSLSRYQNENIRQREEERLLKAVDQFHAMLEELSEQFMAILHEGVSR